MILEGDLVPMTLQEKTTREFVMKRKSKRFAIFLGICFLGLASLVWAEAAKEEKEKMTMKTVSGKIGSKDSGGLALVYEIDKKNNAEREMRLPFSKDVGLQGYKSVGQISEGDLVKITYEETKDGGFKRAIKDVRLVKTAVKGDALVS